MIPKVIPRLKITSQTLNTGRLLEFQHRNLQWTHTQISAMVSSDACTFWGIINTVGYRKPSTWVCVDFVEAHVSVSIVAWLSCFPVVCVFQQLPTIITANIED